MPLAATQRPGDVPEGDEDTRGRPQVMFDPTGALAARQPRFDRAPRDGRQGRTEASEIHGQPF